MLHWSLDLSLFSRVHSVSGAADGLLCSDTWWVVWLHLYGGVQLEGFPQAYGFFTAFSISMSPRVYGGNLFFLNTFTLPHNLCNPLFLIESGFSLFPKLWRFRLLYFVTNKYILLRCFFVSSSPRKWLIRMSLMCSLSTWPYLSKPQQSNIYTTDRDGPNLISSFPLCLKSDIFFWHECRIWYSIFILIYLIFI